MEIYTIGFTKKTAARFFLALKMFRSSNWLTERLNNVFGGDLTLPEQSQNTYKDALRTLLENHFRCSNVRMRDSISF